MRTRNLEKPIIFDKIIKAERKRIKRKIKNSGLSFQTIKRRAKIAYPVLLRFSRSEWLGRAFVEFCPVSNCLVLTVRNSQIDTFSGNLIDGYVYHWQPSPQDLNVKDWFQYGQNT